jgi:hypothetical protein
MSSPDNPQTPSSGTEFDFEAFPADTLFHDRRGGDDRRLRSDDEPGAGRPQPNRRRLERRRRVDPTTFEKQYTCDELEFMTAMQRFKVQTGKAFPSHREVLQVAHALGYRRQLVEPLPETLESAEGRDGINP